MTIEELEAMSIIELKALMNDERDVFENSSRNIQIYRQLIAKKQVKPKEIE